MAREARAPWHSSALPAWPRLSRCLPAKPRLSQGCCCCGKAPECQEKVGGFRRLSDDCSTIPDRKALSSTWGVRQPWHPTGHMETHTELYSCPSRVPPSPPIGVCGGGSGLWLPIHPLPSFQKILQQACLLLPHPSLLPTRVGWLSLILAPEAPQTISQSPRLPAASSSPTWEPAR